MIEPAVSVTVPSILPVVRCAKADAEKQTAANIVIRAYLKLLLALGAKYAGFIVKPSFAVYGYLVGKLQKTPIELLRYRADGSWRFLESSDLIISADCDLGFGAKFR